MADINSLINRIRARVHDNVSHTSREDGRPLYLDEYYIDSVHSGLGRINLDMDSAYTVATLPVKYEYLAELRATINMCYVRGAEGATSDVEDFPDVPDQIVSVPQLTVQRQQMPLDGPKFWLRLGEKLENEYLQALARLESRGEEGAEIQQYVMSRMSLRTGRRMSYVYDKPIVPPEGFAVSVGGSSVFVTWGVVYDEYFNYYRLERSDSVDFSTTSTIYTTSDNHDNTFKDEPGVGSWFYRVAIYNSNDLVSYTPSTSVIVP
jgi:hypothetical protein